MQIDRKGHLNIAFLCGGIHGVGWDGSAFFCQSAYHESWTSFGPYQVESPRRFIEPQSSNCILYIMIIFREKVHVSLWKYQANGS